MTPIYSRIDPTQLLHIINRKADVQPGRKDLVEADQWLQIATIRQSNGVTYKPHRHIISHSEPHIVQESWIVITGLVQVVLYDTDNSILHTDVLEPGDCSITLMGGHTYKFMAADSYVVEVKTGPYFGVEKDKIIIDES